MNRHDNERWQQLLSNLREQRRHVHVLIRLAREQTRVLAAADVERLAQITKELASHLDEMEVLEQQRKEIARQVAEQLRLPTQSPTLTDCIQLAPTGIARTLKWLQRELVQDMAHLRTINERNRLLLTHAAETTTAWIALVVNAATNQASYPCQPTANPSVVLNTEV